VFPLIRWTTTDAQVWFPLPDKPGMKVTWSLDRFLHCSKPRDGNPRAILCGGTLEAMTPEDQAEVWIVACSKRAAIALAAVVVAPAA